MAVNLSKDYKHCRYLDRLVTKDTADLPVGIMANNDFIVRGSYRFAIGEFRLDLVHLMRHASGSTCRILDIFVHQ
ncbi:hypothetical protein AHF37_11945 [Paragonimus kellicotti]|nr:hypothetical protein AHF37_11945 [Paragonimus kellicotti]